MMRVLLDDVHWQDRRSIAKCRECRTHDSSVFLCGWHENVVAATAAVRSLSAPPRTENP